MMITSHHYMDFNWRAKQFHNRLIFILFLERRSMYWNALSAKLAESQTNNNTTVKPLISRTLAGNKIADNSVALLQLHLHSQLNTWLQWVERRQLDTRIILNFGIWCDLYYRFYGNKCHAISTVNLKVQIYYFVREINVLPQWFHYCYLHNRTG